MEVDQNIAMQLDPAVVKSVLLLAWNKRWSNEKWSICLKPYLSSTDGDRSLVAEIIMEQATFGSTPNMQLLSYLHYAVSTNIITLSTAISQVIKFTDVSKIHCLQALINTANGFIDVISWVEESLSLVRSLVVLLRWLLDMARSIIVKLPEVKSLQADSYRSVLVTSCTLISRMSESETLRALIHIGLNDNLDSMKHLDQVSYDIRESLTSLSGDAAEVRDRLQTILLQLSSFREFAITSQPLLSAAGQQMNISLNVIISIDAVLCPTNDVMPLIEQLLVIESTQGIGRSRLYCELFRVCLLGFADAAGKPDELRWAAFTYLKLPLMIKHLMSRGGFKSGDGSSVDKSQELEEGLNQLIQYVSLLDLADSKFSCECLNFLLHELCSKYSVLTDTQCKKIINKRQSMSMKSRQIEPSSSNTQTPGLILRAEPTVLSILKTLDTDHTKNQEALLGILGQMMSGKSFELILSAAATTGKLQCFAAKLIKFNEFAKSASGETSKGSQIRAMLFDISFLMLCHIAQQYGTEVIVGIPEGSSTYFVQWISQCMPDDGQFKSVELFSAPDQSKVDQLLSQLNPNSELKTSLTYWNDICRNIPYAIQEVLWAWDCGAMQQDSVKGILDVVRGVMCCLPVVISAWLCSVISICNSSVRERATFMLKHLLSASCTDPTGAAGQYYTERSTLMQVVMSKMVYDLLPSESVPRPSVVSNVLPRNTPTHDVLIETFRKTFRRGFFRFDDIYKMDYLLSVGGPQWFCDHLVREVQTYISREDLHKGVLLVYSLFHMDLENMTLSLIHHTIPRLLQSFGPSLKSLSDPRGSALAKLCIMCLTVVHRMRQQAKGTPSNGNVCSRKRKRTRNDIQLEMVDDDFDEERQTKMRRLMEAGEESSEDPMMLGSDSFGLTDFLSCTSKEVNLDSSQSFESKDLLSRALVDLFRLFSAVLSDKYINARTSFVIVFMKETLKLDTAAARFILQFMPYNLINQLIKVMPNEITAEFLVNLCDVQTSIGRRTAARAVCLHARRKQLEEEDDKRVVQ